MSKELDYKPMYYDREGKPIKDTLVWAKKFEDRDYKIVEQTTLLNGKFVSTVWLGLDHRFGVGPPLIFETMVFPKKGEWGEEECERYSTEAGAREGHKRMVEKYSV